jgi:hypothetical protein
MNVTDLRRRQATLESVRLDIPRWRFAEALEDTAIGQRPVVAVDWSEIFSYLTFTRPREAESDDAFAIHYAGLNYLLFRLPCQLVLLPPYAEEMGHFITMLRTKALLVKLTTTEAFGEKYGDLVKEITAFHKNKKYKAFRSVLAGDWSAIDDLPDDAWDLLERLFKEQVPSLFLDVQESSAGAMKSLRDLLNSESQGYRRLRPLTAFSAVSESGARRSLEGWRHWLAEMTLHRPRLERQNRADALALGYLQALQQAMLDRGVPVYFASRSYSMLRIMESHAGEFQPYAFPDTDASRRSRSSWRSWDYFAELGYYATWSPSADDQTDPSLAIEQDVRRREAKIDQAILNAERQGKDEVDGASFDWKHLQWRNIDDWEVLRGSFDLEGIRRQSHWSKRFSRPREARVVELLRSVLSTTKAQEFLDRRGQLARQILENIDGMFADCLTTESRVFARPSHTGEAIATQSLVEIATAHLNVATLFENSLKPVSLTSPSVQAAIRNLRTLTSDPRAVDRVETAQRLLHLVANDLGKQALSQGSKDWLAGAATFFGGSFPDSMRYLPAWLDTHSSAASTGLGLATRALCAEAYRQLKDSESGMQVLLDLPIEKADEMERSQTSQNLTWRCLIGQLQIDWMANAKEAFEIFPRPFGRRTETDVILPMMAPVASVLGSAIAPLDLQIRSANILLYLAARHIPENIFDVHIAGEARDDSPYVERQKQRLRWFSRENSFIPREEFLAIERWLRTHTETDDSGRSLHTLGYFNWKVFLLTNDPTRGGDALRYFDAALTRAEVQSDDTLRQLVLEHKGFAAETMRRVA